MNNIKNKMNKISTSVENFFHFKERSATFKKEIIGGLSTFMAMAYILAVNPGMLSQVQGASGYAGVFFLGTAVSAFVATMAMGLFAKVPVALAPGMGVNAFFTYTVAGSILGIPLEQALIATFFSGLLYAIIALTPARLYIAKLLPKNFKLAIGAMIGLFLAYIGLQDSGIIVSDANVVPFTNSAGQGHVLGLITATSTRLGNFKDPFVLIALVTMFLVFALHFMKVKGAAMIAMTAAVIMLAIGYAANISDAGNIFKLQNYQGFGKFGELGSKMWGSIGGAMTNGKIYIAIFVFLYMDFFDTTGTLFAIDEQSKISKTDKKWMAKANVVDAGSTIFGSLMLTSTVTSYVESSVGVSQGARTGFASVVTGSLFALAIAAWPLLSCVMPIAHTNLPLSAAGHQLAGAWPLSNSAFATTATNGFHSTIQPVTGPVLVLVGALMISQLKHFEWSQTIDIPVLFITLVIGMLSYSISSGIAFGVIMYYIINTSALIIKTIQTKRNKPFLVNDEEIGMSDGVNKVKQKQPDFKKRVLNPVMISMFILSIAYIATMPFYAF